MFLSVITICFNESNNIRRTIESTLSLNSTDYEVIIKDGQSIDDTNEIINSYKKQFEKKRIFCNHIIEKDSGIYDAMRTALRYCHGQYVVFMNAGDAFADFDIIEKLQSPNANIDVFYGNAIMNDNGERSIWHANLSAITYKAPFSHQACFFKKELFDEYEYNLGYKISADYELLLRLYLDNKSFYHIETNVCEFYMDGLSSTRYIAVEREHERIFKEHGLSCFYRNFYYMLLAIVKQILTSTIPYEKLYSARRFYIKHFKHYEVMPETDVEEK